MSGGALTRPRGGNRTELLVEQWLHHFAFTVRVPHQEDVGHDVLCVLGEPHGDMTWAGPSFAVQTKSNRRAVTYAKPHAVQWIKGQEIPLFIAVGDARAQSVSLYSTWQRVSAGMQAAVERISFVYSSPPEGVAEVELRNSPEHGQSQIIYMRRPIVSATLSDMANVQTLDRVRRVVRAWIDIDRENIAASRAGIHVAAGPAQFETNEVPTFDNGTQSAIFWNPKNLVRCATNLVRSAVELRLTVSAWPADASWRCSERIAALEAVFREWPEFLDELSKAALRQVGR